MLDRKKDEESAKPAPETAPDNDDPKSTAEPTYEPTPATSKPPAPGLPGMPGISRPAGDGAVSCSENARLSVGRDVEMSGEIESCDLLVVEGTVDATLQNGREIQIGRSGRFSGLVEVEDADISGEFSGKLVVRQRLTVRAGGKIDGEIFYDEIKVGPARGGRRARHRNRNAGRRERLPQVGLSLGATHCVWAGKSRAMDPPADGGTGGSSPARGLRGGPARDRLAHHRRRPRALRGSLWQSPRNRSRGRGTSSGLQNGRAGRRWRARHGLTACRIFQVLPRPVSRFSLCQSDNALPRKRW